MPTSCPVCKTCQVSTRSRQGRGTVSTQKFGAVFKNLGQSDMLGQILPPRAATQRERGRGQRGGAPGRGQKRRGKERTEGLFSRSAAKYKQIAPHLCPKRGCPKRGKLPQMGQLAAHLGQDLGCPNYLVDAHATLCTPPGSCFY